MPQTNTFLQWSAAEFADRDIPRSFYLWTGGFLLATIAYALVTNSPIMAITFILIGIMGFITIEKTPAVLHCSISKEGIIVDRELYDFDNIESFWIIYEEHEKYLSLKTNGRLTPYAHIPLGDENPVTVRDILIQYIEETKHDPTLVDIIGKMLHIR